MNMGTKISLLLTALFLLLSCSSITFPAPLNEQEAALVKKMGGEILPDGNLRFGKIIIDRLNMELSFPAIVNMRGGDLEVLISTPKGRTHESLLVSDIEPFHLQLALILIGAENGLRFQGGHLPQGSILKMDVKGENFDRHPVEEWLLDKDKGKSKTNEGWVFVGSNFAYNGICLAKEEGNIVNIWSFGNTILDNPGASALSDDCFEVFSYNVPETGTKVTVYIKVKAKE
jgi:hypothetical protein